MEQWITLMFLLWLLWKVEAAYYDEEKALRKDLLDNYEYMIRPSRTVQVKVNLNLLNINDLDVPSQRLSVSGWLSFNWNDPRLSWYPGNYSNITDIFDTELIFWRPEIIVDNSISNLGILESDKLLIRARYDGSMTWEPPGIFETHCDVDVTFYPFDTQMCVVEVTSWAQTVQEIDLIGGKIDLTDYEESGEWDVLGTGMERRLLTDGTDNHSEIAFSIKLQRKPMYYVTTILIPVIVTSILCIVVFLLPAESGEKVGYSLTILLTYTVMLTLVASYMPPTSKHTSVLSVYLTIILFIGVFTTLITVIVLHFHHRPQHQHASNWLQFLMRICMLPISGWRPQQTTKVYDSSHSIPRCESFHVFSSNKVHPDIRGRYNSDAIHQDPLSETDSLKYIKSYVNGQANKTGAKSENQQRKICLDSRHEAGDVHKFTWQEAGLILDALCLRVLGVFVVTLTLVVLLAMVIGGRW